MEETEEIIESTPEEELQWIKNKFKQVKSTVKDLETFLKKFEDIRVKLDDDEDGLEVNLERAKKKKEEIDELRSQASQTVKNLKTEIETKTKELSNLELLLQSSKSNSENSFSLTNQISELKSEASNNANLVSNLLKKIQKNSDTIDTLLNNAETNVTNIKDFLFKFNELKGEIEDENNGFKAIIGKVNENLTQSNFLLKSIEETRNISNKNLLEIENEKKIVQQNSGKVKEFKLKSEEDYNEIKKYLDIASDASFAESFKDRKCELIENSKHWKKILIGTIIILVIYLLGVFWRNIFCNAGIPTIESSIFRLVISSPILYMIWFSGSEYSKSKANEEKYAFKFATSSVFRNHIKFMLENFGEDRKGEILETTQNIIEMLYTPTYPSEEKISKTEKEILENYTNKKGKKSSQQGFDDMLNTIQKIKEISADPEILKVILPFLFK